MCVVLVLFFGRTSFLFNWFIIALTHVAILSPSLMIIKHFMRIIFCKSSSTIRLCCNIDIEVFDQTLKKWFLRMVPPCRHNNKLILIQFSDTFECLCSRYYQFRDCKYVLRYLCITQDFARKSICTINCILIIAYGQIALFHASLIQVTKYYY